MQYLLTLIVAAVLHPVHETVAEMEWNPESRRCEVALRMHALDEQWLMRDAKQASVQSKLAIEYLAATFQVANEDDFADQDLVDAKQLARYHWVGRHQEGAHVWWYFEIEPLEKKRPQWIRQRMFFERDQGYTNRIVVLDPQPRFAISLTAGRPTAKLEPQAHESNAPPEKPKS
jgi:hypothetical protein